MGVDRQPALPFGQTTPNGWMCADKPVSRHCQTLIDFVINVGGFGINLSTYACHI